MTDLIFKTKGKETFRIPFPTPGTKCPETQLEIKMTEPITLNLTLEELKLIDKYVELNDDTQQLFDKIKSAYPQPKMHLENSGKFEVVSYSGNVYYRLEYSTAVVWYMKKEDGDGAILLKQITDGETRRLLEGLWFNQIKKGVIDEPEHYDEVEWDEKDNSKPMDDVVERLVKKYQAQKLYNILKDRWCFSKDACEEIVEAVEDWLPEPQSSAGSQNVDTELLVDGFNHCLQKIKEMLR